MKTVYKVLTILIAGLMLAGCKPASNLANEDLAVREYSVIAEKGNAALALLDIVDQDGIAYEITDNDALLSEAFKAGEKDFIIAPITLGVEQINQGDDYSLVSILTWSDLYLVSVNEGIIPTGIAAYGEDDVPGKIIALLNDYFENAIIDYYPSPEEVMEVLLNDEYSGAILNEPELTKAQKEYTEDHDGKLYVTTSLKDLYADARGFNDYPQAALFVRKDLLAHDLDTLMSFTNALDASIDRYKNDREVLADRLSEIDVKALGFDDVDLLQEAYPKLALDFVYAYNCVDEVRAYLDLYDIKLADSAYIQ